MTPRFVEFFIPGIPKSTQTGSVIRVKGRAFPIRRNTAWSAYVQQMMALHKPDATMDGPLYVRLIFARPRLASGKRAQPVTRPDVDNLIKGFLDRGNGILWHDDAQICHLTVVKCYADAPGVTVRVEEIVP